MSCVFLSLDVLAKTLDLITFFSIIQLYTALVCINRKLLCWKFKLTAENIKTQFTIQNICLTSRCTLLLSKQMRRIYT